MIEGSGNTDTLTLAAGELYAPLPDSSVKAIRQFGEELIQVCQTRSTVNLHIIKGVRRQTEANILAYAAVCQKNRLGYETQGVLPGTSIHRRHRLVIDQQLPLARLDQAQ